MDYFNYQHQTLFAEDIPISDLTDRFGTPLYIYSRATLERHWHVFNNAFQHHPHEICYAVKANSNIAILNLLARLGSSFDIVSGGELERLIAAKANVHKIIFSGVGKLESEIERALAVGIGCFNIESSAELERIHAIAKFRQQIAPIAIRVNPNIDARTHPYIATGLKENKFGVDINSAISLYQRAKNLPYLKIMGVAYHIGSQITELQPFIDAFDRVYQLVLELKKLDIVIEHLDIGGGLGVRYQHEQPPQPDELIKALLARLSDKNLKLLIAPGRAIIANAGILVTRVEYLKPTADKNFAIVDAGMNDLIRPALYHAEQEIIPVTIAMEKDFVQYDVVGPVCETGDFLGKNRKLAITTGDLLAIRSAGAYGASMSSNYNSRPAIAEVMVDGDQVYLIRERETVQDLYAREKLMPL